MIRIFIFTFLQKVNISITDTIVNQNRIETTERPKSQALTQTIQNTEKPMKNKSGNKQNKMIVKSGRWMGVGNDSVAIGQPMLVSCIFKGANEITGTNESPNLTLTLNDRSWASMSASARIEEVNSGVPYETKVQKQWHSLR